MEIVNDLGCFFTEGKIPGKRYHHHRVECRCPICGNLITIDLNKVKHQKTCLMCASTHRHVWNKSHGLTGTRIYRIWSGMKRRCYLKSAINYDLYGARGVTVCDEWKDSFVSFNDWSAENGYNDDLVIDRIDGAKGYDPDNCRWVTTYKNAQNKNKSLRNKSGYIGVHKCGNKWRARICAFGKYYSLGVFGTLIEAALAYNNWVIEHGTSHTLNIIT